MNTTIVPMMIPIGDAFFSYWPSRDFPMCLWLNHRRVHQAVCVAAIISRATRGSFSPKIKPMQKAGHKKNRKRAGIFHHLKSALSFSIAKFRALKIATGFLIQLTLRPIVPYCQKVRCGTMGRNEICGKKPAEVLWCECATLAQPEGHNTGRTGRTGRRQHPHRSED